MFKKMKSILDEANNPLGIGIKEYVFLIVSAVIVIVFLLFTAGARRALLAILLILFPIHLLIYKELNNARNKVRMSLCDIQDIFYFQSKIGTPTDVIFANAARIAKEPLKLAFEEATSKYKLTRDIEKALDILTKRFNLIELKAFSIILKQKEETGYSEENHKSQLAMMKRNKRLKKRLEREAKRRNLVIAALLLFGCYSAMVAVPILKEVFNNVETILR